MNILRNEIKNTILRNKSNLSKNEQELYLKKIYSNLI